MFSNFKKKIKKNFGKEDPKEDEKIEENENDDKGLFGKIKDSIKNTEIDEEKFEEIYEEIKILLLENNISYEILEDIKTNLKKSMLGKELNRFKLKEITKETLKDSIYKFLENSKPKDSLLELKEEGPKKILFCGINGSGKTTTIAKMSKKLKEENKSCVLVAADTFRAAAIDQIENHAKKIGVKLIKHDYGSDPAAVVYDAIDYSEAKNKDFVLIDTAGRTNMNENLINELKKISRVSKPDKTILVVDSLVGNDIIDQAKKFNESIGIDGIIATKVDSNKKGGSIISVSYLLKKPIYYLGNGQEYEDLIEFDPKLIVDEIFENEK